MAIPDDNSNRDCAHLRWKPTRTRPKPALLARRMLMDRSRLKLDIVALAVFFASVFLALSLVSYDPADPPSTLVWPRNDRVHNLCGTTGATVAFDSPLPDDLEVVRARLR